MKTLIIVHSYHHNSTQKIAHAISEELGAVVKTPSETDPKELAQYDFIGFGAGIDSGKHYKELIDFVGMIGQSGGKKCFVFSTCGVYSESKMIKDHSALTAMLKAKDYDVIGEFSCLGFNTNSFLKLFGGINKEHPDKKDIDHAKRFAKDILQNYIK